MAAKAKVTTVSDVVENPPAPAAEVAIPAENVSIETPITQMAITDPVVESVSVEKLPIPTPQLAQRGPQFPTIGRIVIFKLSEENAKEINRRRTTPLSIASRIALNWQNQVLWPLGAQAHIGSEVKAGDECAAVVVRVDEYGPDHLAGVNIKVLLDGSDEYWAQAVKEGDGEGCWHWPVRG